MDPVRFVLICLAGWVNREQQLVIEYLSEEVKVLRELQGRKRICFSDEQRRRLAVKAKRLKFRKLKQWTTIVTPQTLARRQRRKRVATTHETNVLWVEDVLFAALQERGGSIAATALLGMQRMQRHSVRITEEKIGDAAVGLAADPESSSLVVATALQIAAEHGRREIEPYARQVAEDGVSIAVSSPFKNCGGILLGGTARPFSSIVSVKLRQLHLLFALSIACPPSRSALNHFLNGLLGVPPEPLSNY